VKRQSAVVGMSARRQGRAYRLLRQPRSSHRITRAGGV